MTQEMVDLQNISKKFGKNTVVENLTLSIRKGEFITLLGPSGCGKTTTLRMIAGFEHPSSGEIYLDGDLMHETPAHQRNVNTVFQSYALFPHLTCFENVAFGLRVKKVPNAEIQKRVTDSLKLVQLEEFGNRKPDQLSGGQKQRIAIARALVNNPKVLLLDEPLGALDQKLRKQMQVELKHLQRQLGITFVFVTHDQEEALTMSDRVAVMNLGQLEQIGSPNDIYDHPKTQFVAEFIGETNLLPSKVLERNSDILKLESGGVQLSISTPPDFRESTSLSIAIRPENSFLSLKPDITNNYIQVAGRLQERIYCGMMIKSVVVLENGTTFISHEKADQPLPIHEGDQVFVNWKPTHAVVLQK